MTRQAGYNADYYANLAGEREALIAARLGIRLTPDEIKLLHMPFREVRMPKLSFLTHRLPWEPKTP